ncbi:MAG: glycosyltransferase [Clostridia bacterium]|nr:glycosyltransferase [Clostridia bacterium]
MINPNVKISLIIPCYNIEEALITRALDSVAAQDFSDYEVIIVDDGSKSEFHEALERVVPKYEKTTLITIPNGGVSNARNVGVSRASGEYVAFLDGDDALTKHFFSESYKAAAETGAEFVIGCVIITESIENFEPLAPLNGVGYTVYEGELVENKLRFALNCNTRTIRYKIDQNDEKGRLYISRGPVARLLKKRLALRVQFPLGIKRGEDIIWNNDVLSLANKVCVVSSHWYWYYFNPESVRHRFDPEMHLSYEAQIKAFRSKLDMQNDNHYLIVGLRVLDCLKLINKYQIARAGKADKALKKAVIRHLYTEDPWTMIKESRFIGLTQKREAVYAKLYKHKMLFFADGLKLKLYDLRHGNKGK